MFKNIAQRRRVWALSLFLLALPLAALPSPGVLGKVINSQDVSLGGVAIPKEGTILENDLLRTGPRGKALLDFSHNNRATILSDAKVQFRGRPGQIVAEIFSGSMVLQSSNSQGLMVTALDYKIAPVGKERTLFYVAVMADQDLKVAAQHGSVAITEIRSGKTYTLSEGRYAAIPASASGVPAQPASKGGQPAQMPAGGWHIGTLSHGASVGLVTAISSGAAAATAIPLTSGNSDASPSTP